MAHASLPWLPESLDALADLALDLRWTWTHQGDHLWNVVKPEMWSQTQNPWLMLQSVSRAQLEKLASDPAFQQELNRLMEARGEYMSRASWFTETHREGTLKPVAYFSMEFGLGEALPLYAGGLGVLAGDYLKTASDLRVPMVGVGILFQEGYFRQMLDPDGWQMEAYPYLDPTSLPILPVISSSGGRVRVPLQLPGRTLWIRAWQAKVGRVMLYLLDTNDPLNSPADRGITNMLYDSRPDIRLMQEIVLGIGGWRVLGELDIHPEVCHMNEGHAAFVVLERACNFMEAKNVSFPVALSAVRAGNIFSTHTPVAAGFDTFPPELIARYLQEFLRVAHIPIEQVLALGRQDPGDTSGPFNMAYLAMRASIKVNAVSKLHGKVSRRIFHSIYSRWPEREVPVTHITNGVHVPSWDSRQADELWTTAGGKGRWVHALENLAEAMQRLTDKDLWTLRSGQCRCLIDFVRERLTYQFRLQGADPQRIADAQVALDPDVLTIGFARRFTDYKRPNLLLTAPDRLTAIITNPGHPVQLVVAGKAHPQDEPGKRLVQQFVQFARQPALRRRVVFLADYDIAIAEQLVQGVDLWLNTPRRPWEACGTSGMKVLVNGGLNVSELDGWWAEAYSPEVGWAIGNGKEHTGPEWDSVEAVQLYLLLEREIIPEFYERDAEGIPTKWVARMRASMSKLAPHFSTNRMLREYVESMYVPVTQHLRQRMANDGQIANEIYEWQMALERYWADLRFGDLKVQRHEDRWLFEVPVYLGELKPDLVSVELYAEPLDGDDGVRLPMSRGDRLSGAANGYTYRGEAPGGRPSKDYTPRIVPSHPAASVPLEDAHILWQR